MRFLYLFIGIWMLFSIVDPAIATTKHRTSRHTSGKVASKNSTTKSKSVKKSSKKTVYTKKKSSRNVTATRKSPTPRRVVTRAATAVAPIYGGSQLTNYLNYYVNSNSYGADVGVYVKSMRTGQTLYSRNVSTPLTPASTMKVLTATAALIYLKPTYQFSTQLLSDSKTIKNGVLQGNLYVVLSGDPTLTYNDLIDLMMNLREQQITAISGNVYIDNTAYDQRFYGPDWVYSDKGYCYGAPISASIINHNCIPVKVSPSRVAGQAAKVETFPNFYYPTIKNYVVTKAGRNRSCGLKLSSDLSSGLEIDGCMSKGQQAWGVSYVVTDIPEYNRSLFRDGLNQIGVQVYGRVTFGTAPSNSYGIAQHRSEPLSEMINDMLKKSDNIIAGALFKKIGQLYTRRPGSWENGSYAVSQILSRAAGVNISGMRILDGSGLSPSNLTTPAQLMQTLDYVYHNGPTSDAFIPALPIAGVDGTLKHRMGNVARRIRAKTGTISGVVSLAGYALTDKREVLAFVIMVNGSKGMTWKYREMEDKIATALTRYQG
jgi:D-alanyl-D-alanine carboxypeptidase/D-alanyl-D-alanine-endopeptidase (penicillin-binding protein 4)